VVDLTFAASGVECPIELSANWLSNDGEPTRAASQKGSSLELNSAALRQDNKYG